jgi:agmatine deiminase
MAWPSSGYTLGSSPSEAQAARQAWAAVANAVAAFEPVTMLCEADDIGLARILLEPAVEIIAAELDDAWMRDIGPTFVKDSAGQMHAVNWVFNGWGAQPWASWGKDAKIAEFVAELTGKPVLDSWLINEGGGIHVNGAGTVLLTETVQLGDGRNLGKSHSEVEAELHRLLGTEKAIWIRRGLTRDYDDFGTRGHIDIVACFADESTILYHDQRDPRHPDFAVSAEVRETLAKHPEFKLIGVPAPEVLRDDEGWVDYSYINHYVVNGGVILCSFDDPNDAKAKEILEQAYPGRQVVLVDARELFARGGGIHCITQQQPQ